jgi:hypothetical protein
VVFREKEPLKNKSFADQLKEERLQCLFAEAIKDIQEKEPPRTIIQILVKTNLIKNFGLDTKNQFCGSIGSTGFIDSTSVIGSTDATSFTSFIENTDTIGFTENIEPTKNYLVLEDITQQLLENKHTFTLGQLFKIALDMKQYVATKLAPGRKIITMSGLNLVIALMVIDLHMVMIQVQVGKNMVEDVLLDGGFGVNILTKELRKWIRLPSLKPTPYHSRWWIKPSLNQLDSSRISKSTFMGFLTW